MRNYQIKKNQMSGKYKLMKTKFDFRKENYNLNIVLIFLMLCTSALMSLFSRSNFMHVNTIIILFFFILILFVQFEVKKGSQSNIKPVDEMDEFFLKKEKQNYLSIAFWQFFWMLAINFVINFIVVCIYEPNLTIAETATIGLSFFLISWMIVRIISPRFISYNYTSESLFYSKKQYLIRIWNFIVLRPRAFDEKLDESELQIWGKNRKEITLDQVKFAREQLANYNDEFLYKLKLYLLYPKDSGGNSLIRVEESIQILIFGMGIWIPIGIEAYFHPSEDELSFLTITLIIICVLILFYGLFMFWRLITNYQIKMQLAAYIPWLIDGEIERRNKI